MNSNEIRQLFLDYFKRHHHSIKASASVIPKHDPTLLFTNAGMVPFKDVFLGRLAVDYKSAASSQLCVRAGGKHNDLENVGYTLRHHTLFEMLGNFSFGDYFKPQAIKFAWQFLTEELKLPPSKLWVTVYKDDDEAFAIWQHDIGLPAERIIRCGEADNFWSMGETGPCGPCSEIFYDHGPDIAGGLPGSAEQDGDRYVEVWNLVFMQYNRTADGELKALAAACVDTGMGLERISAVMQGVADNYETDLFQPLLKALGRILQQEQLDVPAMRVIVDHIRSASFIIAHGVTPSNEGRGYVLRHIIRRALRYGFKLGETQPFFYKMVASLVEVMGHCYPELKANQAHIEQVLEAEEVLFARTLSHGIKLLEAELAQLEGNQLSGKVAFKLYDTYGFPVDLTADIAREKNLIINFDEFNQCLEKQREGSRAGAKFAADYTEQLYVTGETEFFGYKALSGEVEVVQILYENKPQHALTAEQHGSVVLNRTPFYAEGGGQVGDQGLLSFDGGTFVVENTTKLGDTYLHHGRMQQGKLQPGQSVLATVSPKRHETACNHTATHLLHAALRDLLGVQVQQKGSLVTADRLRFDFSASQPLSNQQLDDLELMVNAQIQSNVTTETKLQSLEQAREAGALALFDEKYSNEVRVLKIGDFSHEVCGGTHVSATGQIGAFKIIQESTVAAGVRRIEAVTGQQALSHAQANQHLIESMLRKLNTQPATLVQRLEKLLQQLNDAEQALNQSKRRLVNAQSIQVLNQGKEINDVFVLAANIPDTDKEALLFLADQIKAKYLQHAAILATVTETKKVVLVVSVGQATTAFFKAGELLSKVTAHVAGRGGGRPTLAQGGGDRPENLAHALVEVLNWVEQKLAVD